MLERKDRDEQANRSRSSLIYSVIEEERERARRIADDEARRQRESEANLIGTIGDEEEERRRRVEQLKEERRRGIHGWHRMGVGGEAGRCVCFLFLLF